MTQRNTSLEFEKTKNRTIIHKKTRSLNGWTDAHRGVIMKLLGEVLAQEIVGVLRYKRNESTANLVHGGFLATEFQELAFDQKALVELIGHEISRLGGDPDFTPIGLIMNSYADYVEGRSLPEMIKDGWVAERLAMDTFGEIIRVINGKNEMTRERVEKALVLKKEQSDKLFNLWLTFTPSAKCDFPRQRVSMGGKDGRL